MADDQEPLRQSNFESNLLQEAHSEKFLSLDDLREYNEERLYRRRRLVFQVVVGIICVAALITLAVYFACTHGAKIKDSDDCKSDTFRKISGKCFLHRSVSVFAVEYTGSVEACQLACLSWHTCYSVDFFKSNGECWTFSLTSQEQPGELEDDQNLDIHTDSSRQLESCDHYDRNKC